MTICMGRSLYTVDGRLAACNFAGDRYGELAKRCGIGPRGHDLAAYMCDIYFLFSSREILV